MKEGRRRLPGGVACVGHRQRGGHGRPPGPRPCFQKKHRDGIFLGKFGWIPPVLVPAAITIRWDKNSTVHIHMLKMAIKKITPSLSKNRYSHFCTMCRLKTRIRFFHLSSDASSDANAALPTRNLSPLTSSPALFGVPRLARLFRFDRVFKNIETALICCPVIVFSEAIRYSQLGVEYSIILKRPARKRHRE